MKTLNLVDNRANGGNLTLGAENTNKRTVSDSRLEVGLTISGFLPGVAGNKRPGFGEYLLADLLRFFQLPGAFFMSGKQIEASANKITALKKRSKRKGTTVFSALIFRVPLVYPFTRVSVGSPSIQEVAA